MSFPISEPVSDSSHFHFPSRISRPALVAWSPYGEMAKGWRSIVFNFTMRIATRAFPSKLDLIVARYPLPRGWKPRGKSDVKASGGGRGIRTPEPFSGLTVFKTAGFNHSPIPPYQRFSIDDCNPACAKFPLINQPSSKDSGNSDHLRPVLQPTAWTRRRQRSRQPSVVSHVILYNGVAS
jgi:hypothetical protein